MAGRKRARKQAFAILSILLRLFWQGLVSGMNAARRAQGLETVTLPRNSSYIGTLVDDLVTKVNLACNPFGILLYSISICCLLGVK